MKTFDTAMDLVMPAVPPSLYTLRERADFIKAAQEERQPKHDEWAAEARRSESFGFLLDQLIILVGIEGLSPRDALLTAFVNGLMVGMEMEKEGLPL